MSQLKGMGISDITWTALVLVLMGIIVAMMLLLGIINSFRSDPQGFYVTFTTVNNRPFTLLEDLSAVRAPNRPLFEHALAASITQSLANSQSTGLDGVIQDFTRPFERSFIRAVLLAPTPLFETSVVKGTPLSVLSCGQNAFCTERRPDGFTPNGGAPCSVGSVPISSSVCGPGQVCCEVDTAKYRAASDPDLGGSKYEIVACGNYGLGVCSPSVFRNDATGNLQTQKLYCPPGLVLIGDADKCTGTNNGRTPGCCALATATDPQSGSPLSTGRVPFLYKGRTLFEPREYQCQDSASEICAGEYVTGLCGEGTSTIQCCIPQPIHCKQPNQQHYCMDRGHCESLISERGGTVIEEFCPGPGDYVCCALVSSGTAPAQPYREDNTAAGRTVAPTGRFGSCYLFGSTYTDVPVQGALEVSVG